MVKQIDVSNPTAAKLSVDCYVSKNSAQGSCKTQEVDCCVSTGDGGNNGRIVPWVKYEEGQARSRASDHKHPVTTKEAPTQKEKYRRVPMRIERQARRNIPCTSLVKRTRRRASIFPKNLGLASTLRRAMRPSVPKAKVKGRQ